MLNVLGLTLLLSSITVAQAAPLVGKQQAFVNSFLPKVEQANSNILLKRKQLLQYYQDYKQGIKLTAKQLSWLGALSYRYHVNKTDMIKKVNWQTLLKRVDVIPNSLVLAQSAIESAWGTSRFAKQGNNFFGQYCYSKNCGILPKRRPAGETYELSVFPSAYAAVVSYMRNLNTSPHYQQFRNLRFQQRQQKQALNSIALTNGLIRYSIKRHAYIDSLKSIITKKHLRQYDQTV